MLFFHGCSSFRILLGMVKVCASKLGTETMNSAASKSSIRIPLFCRPLHDVIAMVTSTCYFFTFVRHFLFHGVWVRYVHQNYGRKRCMVQLLQCLKVISPSTPVFRPFHDVIAVGTSLCYFLIVVHHFAFYGVWVRYVHQN
jgi:hypothetical protein